MHADFEDQFNQFSNNRSNHVSSQEYELKSIHLESETYVLTSDVLPCTESKIEEPQNEQQQLEALYQELLKLFTLPKIK